MAIRAFVLLLLCPTLFGAHLATALPGAVDVSTPLVAPASVGMSEPVLRAGVTLFEDAVGRDEIKGAVLLVARRGEVVLHEAVGWRNQEEGLPMERDTLFRMASNTKPVIATAILMLAEEGELGLDDNVRRYMPSWEGLARRHLSLRARRRPRRSRPTVVAGTRHGGPSLQLKTRTDRATETGGP
jgi:CubicO group peptidase (beta-lactamase class C family)